MKNQTLIIILIAVVVGAVGFFGGMQYQKTQRPAFGGIGSFNRIARGAGGQNGRGVIGEITSLDDKSITVKMMDGSTKIVILSSSTSINKQATGSKSDLKTGVRVAVFGMTNSDGSVTAQSIQLNPMMRGFGISPTPKK